MNTNLFTYTVLCIYSICCCNKTLKWTDNSWKGLFLLPLCPVAELSDEIAPVTCRIRSTLV